MVDDLGDFDPRAVYDAAAREYEDASRDFWQYLSARTVDRLGLAPGAIVLDLPCGTGPSLVPAARATGPGGTVVGVDYATQMLGVAAGRTASAGFPDLPLLVGDLTSPPFRRRSFDAVVCVLGIFFVEDMARSAAGLLDLLRPGGRLGLAVFGEDFFEPLRSVFVEAVARVAPEVTVVEPWRRVESLHALEALLPTSPRWSVRIETDDDRLPLASPADWWRIVRGSGLRRTVDALGPERAADVRASCEAAIVAEGVTELATRTRYAVVERTEG